MPRLASGTYQPALSELAHEYRANHKQFIGLKLMPLFPVDKKAAQFPIIPTEALLEMPDDISRRPRGVYARSDYEFEMEDYSCEENGFEEPIDAVEKRLYASLFDAQEVSMMRAMGIVLRKQEKRIADMLFSASNFTPNNVSVAWDVPDTATPISDVETGILAIHNATGATPNTLAVTLRTFLKLKRCAQIVDLIKYTNREVGQGKITAAMIAAALGVEKLEIAGGMYNSAKKGQPAVKTAIWSDDYAMLCVTSDSKDLKDPCVGRTFIWTDDSPENGTVETYEEQNKRCEIIRVRQHTDEEILHADAAYLLGNIKT